MRLGQGAQKQQRLRCPNRKMYPFLQATWGKTAAHSGPKKRFENQRRPVVVTETGFSSAEDRTLIEPRVSKGRLRATILFSADTTHLIASPKYHNNIRKMYCFQLIERRWLLMRNLDLSIKGSNPTQIKKEACFFMTLSSYSEDMCIITFIPSRLTI